MIKKKYLMILSVAVASVLIGSLLYANLVLAVKPEPQPSINKDSVEITLLDGNIASGARMWWWRNITLPFVFTPKAISINITDAWITLMVQAERPAGDEMRFNITVNGVTTRSYVWYSSNALTHVSMRIEKALYENITSGINLVSISNPEYWLIDSSWQPTNLFLYQANVFIEYEY